MEKPALLTKLFQDPKYLKAEIVIVMLGSNDVLYVSRSMPFYLSTYSSSTTSSDDFAYIHQKRNRRKDPSITPQETVRNLELICQALKRTGNENKSIYLCTIPTAGDDTYLTEEQMTDNLTRNQLIEAYCDKYVPMVQWTPIKQWRWIQEGQTRLTNFHFFSFSFLGTRMVCSQDWKWIWRATLKWSAETCTGRTDAISVLLDTQRWPKIGCPLSDLTWSSANFPCSDLTLGFEVSLSLIFQNKVRYWSMYHNLETLNMQQNKYLCSTPNKRRYCAKIIIIERPMLFIIHKGPQSERQQQQQKHKGKRDYFPALFSFLTLYGLARSFLVKASGS